MQDQGTALYIATRLFERALILVFTISVVLALLYVVGNFQGFTDRTQVQLLQILQAAAGITTVAGGVSFILNLFQLTLHRRWSMAVHLILALLAGAIAATLTVGSSIILVVMRPV
jgi:hypothetical protein